MAVVDDVENIERMREVLDAMVEELPEPKKKRGNNRKLLL